VEADASAAAPQAALQGRVGSDDSRGADVSGKSGSADWQRLWVTSRQQAWNSLAVIPSDGGIDIAKVAESLVAAGRLHGERTVTLLNATGAHLDDVRKLVENLGAMTGRGEWVIVAVDPIEENASVVPLVRAASAALLVVRLGESLITSARAAIDTVGRTRFLGSVVLSPQWVPQGQIVQAPPST
jgi:hypothetical protein